MALVDNPLLERLLRSLLGLAAMSMVMSASAKADDDTPELDFLAYLGSWQESDEEWLAVAEWEGANQVEEDVLTAEERKDDENET
jgi:hypothetical protein